MAHPPAFRLRGYTALGLSCLVLLLLGAWLLLAGLNGLSAGRITVTFIKGHPPSLLTAASHPWQFQFEIWCRIVFGTALAVLGALIPVALALASPARRTRALAAAAETRVRRGGVEVPVWVAIAVVVALIAFFFGVAVKSR